MIGEFFPSAARLKFEKPVHTPASSDLTEELWDKAFMEDSSSVGVTSHDILKATKLGISVEVYQQRCREVLAASNACDFMVGDTAWPSLAKDVKKYGKVLVVGVCRHYDNYGTVDWHNPPFILSVSPLKNKQEIIQCTAGWITKREVITNEC